MVIKFKKSSRCGDSACVEVGRINDVTIVRSTTAPENVVTFTKEEWRPFIEGVKAGEFDLDD